MREEGFRLLGAGRFSSVAKGDPVQEVRDTIWGFYQFSKDQPRCFRALVFLDRHVPRIGVNTSSSPS